MVVHGIDQHTTVGVHRRAARPIRIGTFAAFDKSDHLTLAWPQMVGDNQLLPAPGPVMGRESLGSYGFDN
jgi:hypothetical protein